MSKSAAEMKQKAKHEFREMVVITLYFALCFCALATYSMLLLDQFHVKYWNYTFALVNALVITKVIMIGEAAKVGTRYEARPLLLSALYKAFMFCLLVLVFHFAEELIKRLVHGGDIAKVFQEIRIDDLLGRTLVYFCTFLPFFASREFRRVLGEEKFYDLLFRSEEAGRSGRSDLSASS